MSEYTNNLSLPLLFTNQSQKEVIINEALMKIDNLNTNIIHGYINTPPINNNNNDLYIIADNATDEWTGQENKLTYKINNKWYFINPKEGMIYYSQYEKSYFRWNSQKWEYINTESSFIRRNCNYSTYENQIIDFNINKYNKNINYNNNQFIIPNYGFYNISLSIYNGNDNDIAENTKVEILLNNNVTINQIILSNISQHGHVNFIQELQQDDNISVKVTSGRIFSTHNYQSTQINIFKLN